MVTKRNIDGVLGALSQGHREAEKRQKTKLKSTKPAGKPETVVATFTFTVDFLAQIRRLGLEWRDRNLPASACREGAVIQALAQAALHSPKGIEQACGLAKARKG